MSRSQKKIRFFYRSKVNPCHLYRPGLMLVLCLLIESQPLVGQSDNLIFDCVSLEQGLSQSTIIAIAQDGQGFMWFGTIDGLNKFDGHRVKVYRSDPNDSSLLADDWISCLHVGKNGTLWIGSLSGVVNRYDARKNQFIRYSIEQTNDKSTINPEAITDLPYIYTSYMPNTISAIVEDATGRLWIGTFGNGLYYLDQQRQQIVSVSLDPSKAHGTRRNYITSLCVTQENDAQVLWIGTFGGGLFKRDHRGQVSCIPQHNPKDGFGLSDNRILSLYPDANTDANTLWIGTLTGGLDKLSLHNQKFQHYVHDPGNENSLSGNAVMAILKDNRGILWVGTLGNGLNKFNLDRNRIHRYYHEPLNPNSLGSNDVLSLYEDRSGIVWVGTNLGTGVNKFDWREKKFTHYFHDPLDPNSLSENVIYGICEDSDKNLWVGTFQSGLNKYDPNRQKVTHFRHRPGDPGSLPDDHIRSVYLDQSGILWLGTAYAGLVRYDPVKNIFTSFKYNPREENSSGNYVFAICEAHQGTLWLGTKGAGLLKFDQKSHTFLPYRHEPGNPNSICSNFVCGLYLDKSGDLWISTFGGGLNILDIDTGQFQHLQNDPTNPNSLSDNRVQAILQDPGDSSIFWIGTYGGGLNKFDRKHHSFKSYQEKDGLPNNVVYGILADKNGNLWLSTNKGLAQFSPAFETMTVYKSTDGLQSHEFNAGAYHKGRDGALFFGGINGLNSFYPELACPNSQSPPVVLTSFKIFNRETPLVFGDPSENQIALSYKDNFFTFEFAALDYVNPDHNRYAYKLEGFDKTWQNGDTRPYASYTNVSPGQYTFKVKAANSDGVWNETGAAIKIDISPPFWRTWGFYIVTVILFLSGASAFHIHRIRINVKRSLELERIRNAENERIRRLVATDFHDEIGQKLTRISLFSEILKRRLAGIIHEKVDYIEKIIETVQELSGSTRDFIWTLNPESDSLYDVALYLKDYGDDLFARSGIKFQTDAISEHLQQVKLPMEWRRQLVYIFKSVMTQVKHQSKSTLVLFQVTQKKKQFEVGLLIDSSNQGSVIGLMDQSWQNIKNRAERIHGKLGILSNNGSGIAFQFKAETQGEKIPRG